MIATTAIGSTSMQFVHTVGDRDMGRGREITEKGRHKDTRDQQGTNKGESPFATHVFAVARAGPFNVCNTKQSVEVTGRGSGVRQSWVQGPAPLLTSCEN